MVLPWERNEALAPVEVARACGQSVLLKMRNLKKKGEKGLDRFSDAKYFTRLLRPGVLTEENVDELISDCASKTRRETEEYIVAFRPKPVFAPSIRKRPQAAMRATQVEPPSSPPPTPPVEKPKSSPTILQPAEPAVFNFRFSANQEFKDKFERLAEVLGVVNAQAQMADILENAIDIALDKKDPKKKLERRRKRQQACAAPSRSNEMANKDAPAESRYVASEVSERVHDRGHGRMLILGDRTAS